MFFKIIEKIMWIILIYFSLCLTGIAKTLVLRGQQLIDKPTVYKNVSLDLQKGSFLITNQATLELDNTELKGIISPDNPFLLKLISGKLILKNSHIKVEVQDIPENPLYPSSYYALTIVQGQVYLLGNSFTIDKPYTVGLFITTNIPTDDFVIQYNKVSYFHGAFFLIHSNRALVAHNQFFRVSQSNIVSKDGSNNVLRQNIMLLSGNNGVDILDSKNITLSDNYIFSSSCYSVLILRSQDVVIEHNQITGGKTYAIYIAPSLGFKPSYDNHLNLLFANDSKQISNSKLTIIHNYLAQNRYGLTSNHVDGLDVRNNIFIQHFATDNQRKFWTNNDVLLKNTTELQWANNRYKEAFPQTDTPHEKTLKWVNFPLHGGVNL